MLPSSAGNTCAKSIIFTNAHFLVPVAFHSSNDQERGPTINKKKQHMIRIYRTSVETHHLIQPQRKFIRKKKTKIKDFQN